MLSTNVINEFIFLHQVEHQLKGYNVIKEVHLISSQDESNYRVYFAVGQHKFSNQMVGHWKKPNLPKEGRLDSMKNPTKWLDSTKNSTDHGWTTQKIQPPRLDITKNPTEKGWTTQKIQPSVVG